MTNTPALTTYDLDDFGAVTGVSIAKALALLAIGNRLLSAVAIAPSERADTAKSTYVELIDSLYECALAAPDDHVLEIILADTDNERITEQMFWLADYFDTDVRSVAGDVIPNHDVIITNLARALDAAASTIAVPRRLTVTQPDAMRVRYRSLQAPSGPPMSADEIAALGGISNMDAQ